MASFLKACVVFVCLGLGACASTPKGSDGETNIDPYEGFNRAIFGFNNGLDRYILKPVAKGYRFIAPGFVEKGVSNFFSNLTEIRNLLNAGLQGKGVKSLHYTGRFLVNSTVGLFGLFDVASSMGLEKLDGEDFGQTLASWGVGSGPYLVLPILGPSSFRDGVGIPADMYADPINYVEDDDTRTGLTVGKVINTRAGLLDAEELITGDKYIFIRDAWIQRREFLINDGEVEDDFGADLDDEDLDF